MKPVNELTRQEYQVLALVALGLRNAKIAQELYISVRTVKGHLYRIFKKLNLCSRTEAAIYAIQAGLLSNPEPSGNTGDPALKDSYYR